MFTRVVEKESQHGVAPFAAASDDERGKSQGFGYIFASGCPSVQYFINAHKRRAIAYNVEINSHRGLLTEKGWKYINLNQGWKKPDFFLEKILLDNPSVPL